MFIAKDKRFGVMHANKNGAKLKKIQTPQTNKFEKQEPQIFLCFIEFFPFQFFFVTKNFQDNINCSS
jgi:hypothetical protein